MTLRSGLSITLDRILGSVNEIAISYLNLEKYLLGA